MGKQRQQVTPGGSLSINYQPNDQNLGSEWWKILQDPQLDALELQVNVSNQNLKAAEAQFRQARLATGFLFTEGIIQILSMRAESAEG